MNRPIYFNDPTGHRACESQEECDEMGITPSGRELTYNQIMKKLKSPKVKDPEDLSTSDAGLAFIMKWEGFYSDLYNDPGKHCTIGYGHLVHKGPCSGDDSELKYKDGLSKDQAYSLLFDDVAVAEEGVRDLVKVNLTQSQFDALVSLVFNWGKDGLKKSEKLTLLNSGHYYETGQHFNKGPITSNGVVLQGLIDRRREESEIFLYGP